MPFRLKNQRESESVMKTDVKEIKLQAWQEIIGHCVRFQAKKNQVAVILRVCGQNARIAYQRNSRTEYASDEMIIITLVFSSHEQLRIFRCYTQLNLEVKSVSEEKMPISEKLKVIRPLTIYKTEKWWLAVALVESFGRKQIATYLWTKKEDQWKRKQKFVVHSNKEWLQIKEAIEKLLPELK
jgi:hypothetical protein